MASQGNYDHPSYLTRQQINLGASTAGASGTSCRTAFLSNMRIRNVTGVVQVAGTTSGAAAAFTIQTGTTSVGVITLSTNVINTIVTSGDLNVTLNTAANVAGVLSLVGGADATVVGRFTAECYIDPAASWTGSGN